MYKALFLSTVLVISALVTLNAQPRYFTGTITYKITYPANASSPLIASLPATIDMQVSANKARFELTLPNGKQTFIVNGDDLSVTRLMDLAQGKFYIKKTKEDFQKDETPITVPLKETKLIAGYKCKAAEINSTDRGGKALKSKAFYSDELGHNNIYFNTIAKGIKGILLDFDYSGLGTPMHLTATEVSAGRISNKIFEIPSDYKQTTEAQLQQLRQVNKSK